MSHFHCSSPAAVSRPQVAKPLDVKTKFMNMEDEVLLEVQIQNITPNPMFLEVVNFDPSATFSSLDLNNLGQQQEQEMVEE